jgi:Holliday junction resolvase
MNKKNMGRYGEETVVLYLQQLGFVIIHRNFFWCKHEIDIIAKRNDKIYLFEVKTVRCLDFLKISKKQKISYESFALQYFPNEFVSIYLAIVNEKTVRLVLIDA